MDKLRAMQVFIHIADEGSLTAAARVMASSLPAMVRTLAALETHLGVRLFNRTTRRIALTDEGRRYLNHCRTVLSSVQDAEESLNTQAGEPRGQLVITAPVLFGQMYVAPAVTRFVQRYPEVHCRVLLHDRVVNLLDEGVDVGVRIGALEDSSLVAQTVFSIRRIVVASPDYLRKHGVPSHPRELQAANCVRFTAPSGPWWTFHDKGKTFNVPVTGNLEFNNAAPAVDACAAGMGFGMFISYQAAPLVQQKKLVVVLEDFEPPKRPVSVVYPHARLLPARTRIFIEWMKNELLQLNHAAPVPHRVP
ncbi:LysR family transcriptional regulator [Polaromonas sp.]|uniref:LysR family transcriptional regulator n=1 Tax=Polaromonas sp. TaxID=1869339 RepID=UPI003BA8577F